jgi:uncharacterized protein involved in exopolysaccharide biosynthesis
MAQSLPMDSRAEQLLAVEGPNLSQVARQLYVRWPLIAAGAMLAGALAFGGTFMVRPRYAANMSFLPPQQSQSGAASLLSSLGGLAGMTGGLVGVRAPADQYVALMQSITVSDRIVDAFDLQKAFAVEYRAEARKRLAENVQVTVGKKDGLIYVEVEDTDPRRAAEIANRYVVELRHLADSLALTEAQQRRAFFQQQMERARDNLAKAQIELQGSGFGAAVLKAEPKAAVEGYARLRAEVTTAEVRLQTLRRRLTDSAPEVQQALAAVGALRTQLARSESAEASSNGPDYITKYREYRYQETLFELLAKQFELARVEEAREGSLFQVVDVATVPERASGPRRLLIAAGGALAGLLLSATFVLGQVQRRV